MRLKLFRKFHTNRCTTLAVLFAFESFSPISIHFVLQRTGRVMPFDIQTAESLIRKYNCCTANQVRGALKFSLLFIHCVLGMGTESKLEFDANFNVM
jgi:hypothetical protein